MNETTKVTNLEAIKAQKPGEKAIQGPKPVLHRTGRTVVGYFTPGNQWVKIIGPVEARLYKDWEPVYKGFYRCEVLDCAKYQRPILVPRVASTPEEFWAQWDLTRFWEWVDENHPGKITDRNAVEERLKNLVMYDGASIADGIMNLFNACRDRVAFLDSMSKEDCDGVWEQFNQILERKRQLHDVQAGWREDFVKKSWDRNLRHFVSYTSRRIFAALCDQTPENCEYVWQVIQYWDYNTQHPLTDNYFLSVDRSMPRVFSSMSELKDVKCKAVFADGSYVDTNLWEALSQNRATCVNFTLVVNSTPQGVQIYPVREIMGSYTRFVFERRPVLIYKHGNFYLKHPETLARKKANMERAAKSAGKKA